MSKYLYVATVALLTIFGMNVFLSCNQNPHSSTNGSVGGYAISIETVEDQLMDQETEVSINLDRIDPSIMLGQFDLWIAFDTTNLTLEGVSVGQFWSECGGGSLTIMHGPVDTCGDSCPSGLVHLIGWTDIIDGPIDPNCYNSGDNLDLARLNFYVKNDSAQNGQLQPIDWYWVNCASNSFLSASGDSLIIANKVFQLLPDTSQIGWVEITNHTGFPSYTGHDTTCHSSQSIELLEKIEFRSGGIFTYSDTVVDGRGDINNNGIDFEIADAVMFSYYFTIGESAFGSHVEASTTASDINIDGTPLGVGDFVYLVRIIQNNSIMISNLTPYADTVNVATHTTNGSMTISYDASTEIGAMSLVFELTGSLGVPAIESGATDMTLAYNKDGSVLRVFIYDFSELTSISSGQHDLITLPFTGSLILQEVETSDFYGSPMISITNDSIASIVVGQNYPDPFGDRTSISILLPLASSWEMEIKNADGILVRSFSGFAEAGETIIEWDGTDEQNNPVPDGIYFYCVTALGSSVTKYMVLTRD